MSAADSVNQDMAGAHWPRHAWQMYVTNALYLGVSVEYFWSQGLLSLLKQQSDGEWMLVLRVWDDIRGAMFQVPSLM